MASERDASRSSDDQRRGTTPIKLCRFEGCKSAVRKQGVCGRHGGRDHCSLDGCDRVSRGRLKLCFAHTPKPDKPQCSRPNCRRAPQAAGGLCNPCAGKHIVRGRPEAVPEPQRRLPSSGSSKKRERVAAASASRATCARGAERKQRDLSHASMAPKSSQRQQQNCQRQNRSGPGRYSDGTVQSRTTATTSSAPVTTASPLFVCLLGESMFYFRTEGRTDGLDPVSQSETENCLSGGGYDQLVNILMDEEVPGSSLDRINVKEDSKDSLITNDYPALDFGKCLVGATTSSLHAWGEDEVKTIQLLLLGA